MNKFSSIKLWLARLQREIEESSLGALGLCIGLFGILLGLFTSWTQLESWLIKNWIEVIAAILSVIAIIKIFNFFAHKIRRVPSEEQTEIALSYLKRVLDNGSTIQLDDAVKFLIRRGMERGSANEALDMLIKSRRLKKIEDGTVTLMNIEDENK